MVLISVGEWGWGVGDWEASPYIDNGYLTFFRYLQWKDDLSLVFIQDQGSSDTGGAYFQELKDRFHSVNDMTPVDTTCSCQTDI